MATESVSPTLHPITRTVSLDENEIEFTAMRAQGSGGQKVNKVSAAIHLRYDIAASSLPDDVKDRLLALKDKRITQEGIVVIKSQQHRSREQNRNKAIARLVALIKSVMVTPKKRIPTKPSKNSVRRRLDAKKRHASKKRLRGKVKGES